MRTSRIGVSEIVDATPLSRLQIATFALLFSVALFDGYDIGTVSSMSPLIADHFGVSVKTFGTFFASGFIGMMIGALVLGSWADRIGRRWTIIISTLIFGLFTLGIAFAPSIDVMIALRFMAGVGLGGALPNIVSMSSEFAPRLRRSFIVTLVGCGVPLGGILAPLLGSVVGPRFGWQASFLLGGGLPVLICPLLVWKLPESLRYLATRPDRRRQLRDQILAIKGPQFEIDDDNFTVPLDDEPSRQMTLTRELFMQGRAITTLLLWSVFFLTLLTSLFIVSWLPSVLRESGLSVSLSLVLASLFSAGGLIGSPAIGYAMDKLGPYPPLFVWYFVGGILTILIGYTHTVLIGLGCITFCAGFFIFGTASGVQALAAAYYPTAIRSTGVGWAYGVGRVGSIVGPLLGGLMLSGNWSVPAVFTAAGIPPLLAAAICVVMWVRNYDHTPVPVNAG